MMSVRGLNRNMSKKSKTTLIFPGQGSQYAGMGKNLYDHFKAVRDIYREAGEVLGYDVGDLCFSKPSAIKDSRASADQNGRDLNRTVYTQPAVLTTSYACFSALDESCRKHGIELNISTLAGHSLGEYTALLISGALDFKTCLGLVKKRAAYMSQVGEDGPGSGLMAIISKNGELSHFRIETLCRCYGVHITLNNTKRQIVVGGQRNRLKELARSLKKEALSTAMLNVEGPFHTPIMKAAATKFKKELEKSNISLAARPVVANVTKEAIMDPVHIKTELYEQIFKAVDWKGSMEKIIGDGADTFIEVGPKRVLTRMLRDIDHSVRSLNVEDMASLGKTLEVIASKN